MLHWYVLEIYTRFHECIWHERFAVVWLNHADAYARAVVDNLKKDKIDADYYIIKEDNRHGRI